MEFRYRYRIMKTIAYKVEIPPISITTLIMELITLEYVVSERADLCSANIYFSRVQQKLWPTTQSDGTKWQHINNFHLTLR